MSTPSNAPPSPAAATARVAFKSFDSKMASREKVFRMAAEFASQVRRDQLINITHSEDRDNIAVTIWYWTDEPEAKFEMRHKAVQKTAPTAQAVPAKNESIYPSKPEPIRRTGDTMVPLRRDEPLGDSPGGLS